MEVFENGYAGATTAAIARRAHVSVRSLYEHFAGKEDLLLNAYRANQEFSYQVLGERLSSLTSWPDRFLALLQTPVDTVAGAYELHLGLYLGASTAGRRALEELLLLKDKFAVVVVDEANRARRIDPEFALISAEVTEEVGAFVADAYAILLVSSMKYEVTPDELVSLSARLLISVLGISVDALRTLDAAYPARAGLRELIAVASRQRHT